jgi:hypothetical protein
MGFRFSVRRQGRLTPWPAVMIVLALAGCGKSGSDQAKATFTANPNPIIVTDGTKTGVTKLTWNTLATKEVEIRVGKPDGPVLCKGSGAGSCDTLKWVTDGMTFYLQDSTVKATEPSATLATVTVQVK